MAELLPCPFCGVEAEVHQAYDIDTDEVDGYFVMCRNKNCTAWPETAEYQTEAEAIAAWNTRAAMEFDNWFYLPKPKEPIAEVTETTHAWDGTKVKIDAFYQVQKQAVINLAKELDEHIIKRICEVWNTRAERTCRIVKTWSDSDYIDDWNYRCSECRGFIPINERDQETGDVISAANYCPNCGAKVVD